MTFLRGPYCNGNLLNAHAKELINDTYFIFNAENSIIKKLLNPLDFF